MPFLLTTFLLIFTIQIGFFIFALAQKTDKFTDLAYGLTFVVVAWFALLTHPPVTADKLTLTLMVTLWGARLATYLFYRILKIGRDTRFDTIRHDPIKFGSFWLLQAVSIFVISLAFLLFLSLSSPAPNQLILQLGTAISLLGIILEAFADWQKFVFKLDPKNKNAFIQIGLWRFARHPNYFGEMLVWWGLYIATSTALSPMAALTALLSPLWITTLLLFISGIPTLEKRYDQKYRNNPDYQQYKQRTNLLIPLPWRLF
jgi:steroid 5-alpha reductase family enzyme